MFQRASQGKHFERFESLKRDGKSKRPYPVWGGDEGNYYPALSTTKSSLLEKPSDLCSEMM